MKTYLKPVQGAVVLHEEVFLFTDREVVTKLTEKVSKVYRLHCYKGSVFNMTSSSIASLQTYVNPRYTVGPSATQSGHNLESSNIKTKPEILFLVENFDPLLASLFGESLTRIVSFDLIINNLVI